MASACVIFFAEIAAIKDVLHSTEALVFMFNGGRPYGFTIHPIFTYHMNNEKHVHHGFLAPWPYLCSTSLNDPKHEKMQ